MNARRLDQGDSVGLIRVPPSAFEAEQSVLGVAMVFPDKLSAIAEKVSEADFFRRDHRLIWRAILDLASENKPYDAVTLGEWMEGNGLSEQVGGAGYLIDLASGAWSAASVLAYADIVRDRATLRRAIEIGSTLVDGAFNPQGKSATALLDATIRELMTLSQNQRNCDFTMKEAVKLAWDDAQLAYESEGAIRGITTGFARMDKRLGGWHKQDLVILGARPSMGKTALMVNLALNAASQGHAVGMISGEQSAMQIGQRSIAVDGSVVAERMRNGGFEDSDWPKLTASMARLVGRKIRIFDKSAPTLDEIGRIARKWKHEDGIEVLFVDYLQRIKVPKAESRTDEVASVAIGLKTLARDLDIPIVALAQVKAEVDKRSGDKRPGLGDIANSDEATREADQIGFLYRNEVYSPDDQSSQGIAELNFEKNRHGPTGQFKFRFFAETMMFGELDPGPAQSGRDRQLGNDR